MHSLLKKITKGVQSCRTDHHIESHHCIPLLCLASEDRYRSDLKKKKIQPVLIIRDESGVVWRGRSASGPVRRTEKGGGQASDTATTPHHPPLTAPTPLRSARESPARPRPPPRPLMESMERCDSTSTRKHGGKRRVSHKTSITTERGAKRASSTLPWIKAPATLILLGTTRGGETQDGKKE